jgi:CRP/FNR family transcriptional regulator
LGISVDDDHAFSAEAIGDSTLCCFPRALFDDFVETHPAMEHELYRLAAHELASAKEQLVLLGRKTAAERLASFLLVLAERSERVTGKAADIVELPMNRADVADYLGLTKETVSRSFSLFRADRLIRFQALDRAQILDRRALEQLAEY